MPGKNNRRAKVSLTTAASMLMAGIAEPESEQNITPESVGELFGAPKNLEEVFSGVAAEDAAEEQQETHDDGTPTMAERYVEWQKHYYGQLKEAIGALESSPLRCDDKLTAFREALEILKELYEQQWKALEADFLSNVREVLLSVEELAEDPSIRMELLGKAQAVIEEEQKRQRDLLAVYRVGR